LEHSKSKIKKLGSKIRKEYRENGEISQESLEVLHDYRISFKDPMSDIFRTVTKESRKIRSSAVRTYRIKRIESIISKLKREENMGLIEMGDIAGCRIIVKNEVYIPKIVEAIKAKLNVVKERDYILKPRKSGYKSHHLMIQPDIDDNFKRLVEVQIRSQEHHNWATLVEITDQLYRVKVKEGEEHEKLKRFHFLLSKKLSDLTLDQMVEIIEIEKEFNIYRGIIKVILKNYIKLRSAWLKLNHDKKDKYFILEVSPSYETEITTFSDFEEAQAVYLLKFIKTPNNVVLTHISNASFDNISSAYSNYVLTMHKYELDIFRILFEVLNAYSNNRNIDGFNNYLQYTSTIFGNTKKHIIKSINKINNTNYSQEKKDEWITELSERVNNIEPLYNQILKIEAPKSGKVKISKQKPEKNNTYKKFINWLNT